MMSILRAVSISAILALGGCQMPSAAPTATQIESASLPDWDVYVLKMSPPIIRAMAAHGDPGFPESLRFDSYRPTIALRPGDVVGVSIYETGGSSLFGTAPAQSAPSGASSAAPAQTTTLPPQIVEADGQILIPFVGRVRVAGRTPIQAADLIQDGLSSQTVRPQVLVSLLTNTTSTVAVGGEVNRAGQVALTLRGERLLDVIAQAGGPKYPATETDVRIIRGKVSVSIPLQRVLSSPDDNVAVRPNDNVVLVRNPKTFVVMGSSQKVSQYSFDTERVTLAEAIARSGGGIDTMSNIAGIYLFRYEPTPIARTILRADASAVDSSFARTGAAAALNEPDTRMVYRVDLTQSGGYFYAQSITLRDKDIVLVTNAESTEVMKFLLLIRGVTGLYSDINRNTR